MRKIKEVLRLTYQTKASSSTAYINAVSGHTAARLTLELKNSSEPTLTANGALYKESQPADGN